MLFVSTEFMENFSSKFFFYLFEYKWWKGSLEHFTHLLQSPWELSGRTDLTPKQVAGQDTLVCMKGWTTFKHSQAKEKSPREPWENN